MTTMYNVNRQGRPLRRIDISINMEKTGANIKRLVKNSGYSVRDIMQITGISSEQAIYKWFKGKSIPAIETQLALCELFGLDIHELLVLDGEHFFSLNSLNSQYLLNCWFIVFFSGNRNRFSDTHLLFTELTELLVYCFFLKKG